MKLLTIVMLLLAVSCIHSKPDDWNKYLVNIDLTKEPIQEEWVSQCVTGFKECHYEGETANWCPGAYKFTVWNNEVRPEESAKSGSVKSLKVPKGYVIQVIGAFMHKFFNTKDQKVKDAISNLKDGEHAVDKTTNTDESCSVQTSYWRMVLKVSVTQYVAITQKIPAFLRALIASQDSLHRKGSLSTTLKKCQTELTNLKNSSSSLQTTLANLIREKDEFEATILILQKKIQQNNQIIKGEMTQTKWAEFAPTLKQENEKIQADIKVLEKKVKEKEEQIAALNKKIQADSQSKIKLQDQVSKLMTEDKNANQRLTAELTKLQGIENKSATVVKAYTELDQVNKNIKTQRTQIEEQIAELQKTLKKLTDDARKNEGELIKMEKTIEKLVKSQQEQHVVCDNLKKETARIASNIATTTKKITETDETISKDNTQLVALNNELIALKQEINTKNTLIDNNTQSAINKAKESLEKENVGHNTNISIVLKKLNDHNAQITKIQTQINTNNNLSIERQDCVTTNTSQVTLYDNKFQTSFQEVNQIMDEIKTIYDGQSAYLDRTAALLNEFVPLQEFVVEAKRTLHEYLDQLPDDPQMMNKMLSALDKRRRKRRFIR